MIKTLVASMTLGGLLCGSYWHYPGGVQKMARGGAMGAAAATAAGRFGGCHILFHNMHNILYLICNNDNKGINLFFYC